MYHMNSEPRYYTIRLLLETRYFTDIIYDTKFGVNNKKLRILILKYTNIIFRKTVQLKILFLACLFSIREENKFNFY